MQRTIRIQLEPSPYQADALAETSRQFTSAFNQTARLGWEADVYNAIKLHYLAYYAVKEAHPTLVSDLINQARVKAAEALRSAFALRKQGREVCMPQSSTCPPRYNVHTYRVDWESQTVRMSLVGGRQTIRLRVPHYAAKYAGYPTDTADLIEKEGTWWLHVVVTVPAPHVEPTEQVVGIDLGINRPAVASNNRFVGQRRWKAIEGRYFKQIRALQTGWEPGALLTELDPDLVPSSGNDPEPPGFQPGAQTIYATTAVWSRRWGWNPTLLLYQSGAQTTTLQRHWCE